MEKTASDLSQQSAQDEGVAKEASESVADMKAKLCHEGGGDILKRSGDKSSINHMQNGMNGTVSQSRHSSSSKSKEHGSSSKHGSSGSGSGSHKHSTSASSHKHDQGNSSSHKYVSSSSGSSSKHKEGSSSSSGKHRDGSSSSKDKHGEKISSKEKHGEDRSSNKEKQGNERLSSGEKQGNSSRGEDKHHESSSSSKDKAKHNSSSNYSREKEKSSDKLKSSASSKEGDKHKSSSSNKHEDKEREKSKERSSSKHKEGSSGGSGERKKEEKPKGIDRPKDNRDVEKDKEKSSDKQQPKQVVDLKPKIKEEPKSPVKEEYSPVKDNFILSGAKKEIKQNPESDDDLPLAQRVNQDKPEKAVKRPAKDDADDDEPLAGRLEMVKKIKKEEPPSKPVKKRKAEESYDDKPLKKVKKVKKEGKQEREEPEEGKKKRGKKEDEQPEVWKWWEEEKRGDGVKWTFLEHKGPVFAPPYEPLPNDVSFYYDGKKMKLSPPAEEVATFYAKMLKKDYTASDVFNDNFFEDWSKMMTPEEKSTITDLRKCNFKEMYEHFEAKKKRKNMSDKKAQNEAIQKEYGVCVIDGREEKIKNFKIEHPGLFRGKGSHQGMLKMRINPEDVTINCSRYSRIPEPPSGHSWKEVLHDSKVTWLASWTENIQGHTKYVILNAPFKLKGEKGWQKYEIARKLQTTVDKIRAQYREDWKSKEMRIRQRAVALYFIDKLALSVYNEKEEGETADTVGCCSLRVEHIKLHDELDGQENVVKFDFLGKDSIRYYNTRSVDKQVYENLKLFKENKQPGDYLFDQFDTCIISKHLNSLMEGLTAKVFHTFNASKTLQEQLNLLKNSDGPVPAKLQFYKKAVAISCNHQQSESKNISEQMETLQIKDENKEIVLGTFKLNNLDPRISVAWCKKWNVPLEEIYNETHLTKFSWAIDLTEPDFKY